VIAFLTGRVAYKNASSLILDVHGVGYQLSMSTNSLASLPAEGDHVMVHTYLHVREDELSLFGFESVDEKESFAALITVSGVGPKVALSVLSSFSPESLCQAVAAEDVALISTVPGIGKKTAQRLILELGDKLGSSQLITASKGASGTGAALAETKDALLAMGFSPAEVGTALKGAPAAAPAPELLKYALKRLGSGERS